MNASPTLRRLAPVLLVLALLSAARNAPRPQPASARFVVPPAMAEGERPALWSAFESRLIGAEEAASAHACSLATTPDGSLLVAWFAGSREGAADVSIRMHRYPARWFGSWRTDGSDRPADGDMVPAVDAWQSLTREQLQKLTSRSIRKLGNPVIWFDGAGRLHLSVVSVSLGGWSGSAVNDLVSDDEGRNWTSARRLVLAPFFNFSTLVRTQPQVLQDGSIGLPAYHEFVHKWGMWVRMTPDGSLLQTAPMRPLVGGTLQPAVVAVTPTDAVAALRASGRAPRLVAWSATRDTGATWAPPPADATPDIANPDSSVAMIRLQDGSLLLACNPLERGRNRLQLFRSTDAGATWTPGRTIVASADTADEFSYPALVQARDGLVHLGFTFRRTAICLCTFSPEWLAGPDDGSPAMPHDPPVTEAAP